MPRKPRSDGGKRKEKAAPLPERKPRTQAERPDTRRNDRAMLARAHLSAVKPPATFDQPIAPAMAAARSEELLLEACSLPAFVEPYVLQTDPPDLCDIGSLLMLGFRAEMKAQLSESRQEAWRVALDDLLRTTIGQPRPARPGGALVVLSGLAGTIVPPHARLVSSRRSGDAFLRHRRGLALGAIRESWGLTVEGDGCDITTALVHASATPAPNDAEALGAVWFGLHLPLAADFDGGVSRDRRFPGFVWDLPVALSLRISGVRAVDSEGASIPLRWARRPGGPALRPAAAGARQLAGTTGTGWVERLSLAGCRASTGSGRAQALREGAVERRHGPRERFQGGPADRTAYDRGLHRLRSSAGDLGAAVCRLAGRGRRGSGGRRAAPWREPSATATARFPRRIWPTC